MANQPVNVSQISMVLFQLPSNSMRDDADIDGRGSKTLSNVSRTLVVDQVIQKNQPIEFWDLLSNSIKTSFPLII